MLITFPLWYVLKSSASGLPEDRCTAKSDVISMLSSMLLWSVFHTGAIMIGEMQTSMIMQGRTLLAEAANRTLFTKGGMSEGEK